MQTAYDGVCGRLTEAQVKEKMEAGQPFVIRLRVPRKLRDEHGRESDSIFFDDGIRGRVGFHLKTVDEQVLMKTDGFPTYHLANVVDDHLMQISHVIRGEEWLSSTPKHVLLYQAFGWTAPHFFHLPLLLDKDRNKLSKRSGDASVDSYIEQGYLPEAVVNFLALLGWNIGVHQTNRPGAAFPGTSEIFTLSELVKLFELERVQKSGAIVEVDRLRFLKGQHLRRLCEVDVDRAFALAKPVFRRAFPHLTDADDEFVKKVMVTVRERVTMTDDFATSGVYFFREPDYDSELGVKARAALWTPKSAELLSAAVPVLDAVESSKWTGSNIMSALKKVQIPNTKPRDLLHTLRFVLTADDQGVGISALMETLGKEVCLRRLRQALNAFV